MRILGVQFRRTMLQCNNTFFYSNISSWLPASVSLEDWQSILQAGARFKSDTWEMAVWRWLI